MELFTTRARVSVPPPPEYPRWEIGRAPDLDHLTSEIPVIDSANSF